MTVGRKAVVLLTAKKNNPVLGPGEARQSPNGKVWLFFFFLRGIGFPPECGDPAFASFFAVGGNLFIFCKISLRTGAVQLGPVFFP
jgi:hypothetical protein